MGMVVTARKNGMEKCPGCIEEARVNEQESRYALCWDLLESQVLVDGQVPA